MNALTSDQSPPAVGQRAERFAYGGSLSDCFSIGHVTDIRAEREGNLDHMTNHPTSARPHRAGVLLAGIAVAMLLGGTAACSSDSEAETKSTGSSPSAPSSKASPNEGRPDGFPADVPLPEAAKIDTIKSATDATPGMWVVMVTVDPTLAESGEKLKAAFGTQLEEAGYEVSEPDGSNVSAQNEDWEITFHSSMDGTLTIATSPN